MKIRMTFAILVARVVQFACKAVGKQGVTLAGKIAQKIYPPILQILSGQVRKSTIVVCGTNGKTTTNNLMCAAFEAQGQRVVCNRTGSNMLYGVITAYVLAADLRGKINADYACIEIDEASAIRVFPYIKPDYMVITNLFRDQLDRYGEIDTTMDLLKKAIDMVPRMKLVINGDDALSAYLAQSSGHQVITFGVSEKVNQNTDSAEIREGRFCKKCGGKLEYDFYHYSQLGVYRCTKCGFQRPKIDVDASQIDLSEGLAFTVDGKPYKANYRGFYNIYNLLAVYTVLRSMRADLTCFETVLRQFSPENGRNEMFHIDGTNVLLNLAKNPAGFNQNIASVMSDQTKKDIIIVINDQAQDGRDISWLWDVDFEYLWNDSVHSIIVSGIRGLDMRLRLKYVDIPAEYISDVKTAVEDRLQNGCGNLYVLVNYTALYPTHKMLQKMTENYKR